ncbi:DinB family protein [Streptomyces lonarensis]|uniref:DinB family protein n=1 Tax=Streptomyces lonarensis TaxID=700599 RepID=A0A7X6HZR8_9ACTN|nr:DinB family protein [Streptomyces lonarensis]NJQ06795.1 DinB family protein [Streptomyces lonarensis]
MKLSDPKETLRSYLQEGRDALLWKLDGLSEYDVRRPLTPTGSNLLGLVKHNAGVEMGYFGLVFGRPVPDAPAWMEQHDVPNIDMWATPEESREEIVDLYRRAWAHSDTTITELTLESTGQVPWWGGNGAVNLHRILVHVATETHRHAGHADILREQVDGAVGLRSAGDNLPEQEKEWWAQYRDRVEAAARAAADRA